MKAAAVLALLTSLSAFGSSEANFYNKYVATRTATALTQIKKASDVPKLLRMNRNDTNLYMNTMKAGFAPIRVLMMNPMKISIQVSNESIAIDFSEYANGTLFVDNKKFSLSEKKTFINYKSAIQEMLRAKYHVAAWYGWLLPQAEAGAVDDFLSSLGGGAVSGAASQQSWTLEPTVKPMVAMSLINGYKADAKSWRTVDEKDKRLSPAFSTFVFTCKGSELGTVRYTYLAGNTGSNNSPDYTLEFLPNKGYRYSTPACTTEADMNGDFQKSTEPMCPRGGENLFESTIFYNYPKLAAECCQTSGCYQKVSAALAEVKASFAPDAVTGSIEGVQ